MKQGHRTTEFWVNLGFNLVCLVMLAFMPDQADSWIPLIAMGLSNAGYSVSRGQAKSNGNGEAPVK